MIFSVAYLFFELPSAIGPRPRVRRDSSHGFAWPARLHANRSRQRASPGKKFGQPMSSASLGAGAGHDQQSLLVGGQPCRGIVGVVAAILWN